MNLYNLSKLRENVFLYNKNAKVPMEKEHLKELFSLMSYQNLIKKEIMDEVFFHNTQPPFFISETALEKAEQIFNKNVGKLYNLKDILEAPLLNKEREFISFKVKTIEDYDKVFEIYVSSSDFGKKIIKDREFAEKRKQKNIEKMNEKIADKKHKIDLVSSLNRDFEKKNVLSLDFEFFIKPNKHEVSEVGLSLYSNGERCVNIHYLVEEHYKKKIKNEKQEKFAFGETGFISEKDIPKVLDLLLKKSDFLLLHEAREELEILSEMKIFLKDYSNITMIDTQEMYKRYYLRKNVGTELSEVLKNLKIPFSNNLLHNAGNDAEYTSQALMKMRNEYKLKMEEKRNKPLKTKKM